MSDIAELRRLLKAARDELDLNESMLGNLGRELIQKIDASLAKTVGPDMFWDDNDPERCHHTGDDLASEIYTNEYEGAGWDITVDVQCAVQLPNRKMRVHAVELAGEKDYDWEWIEC